MTYSKRQFGIDLRNELAKGFDVVRLSRWAFGVRMERCRDFENGLDDIVMSVVAMEEGREFEYSEAEFRELAEQLSER